MQGEIGPEEKRIREIYLGYVRMFPWGYISVPLGACLLHKPLGLLCSVVKRKFGFTIQQPAEYQSRTMFDGERATRNGGIFLSFGEGGENLNPDVKDVQTEV
jgi:hypothetical protein